MITFTFPLRLYYSIWVCDNEKSCHSITHTTRKDLPNRMVPFGGHPPDSPETVEQDSTLRASGTWFEYFSLLSLGLRVLLLSVTHWGKLSPVINGVRVIVDDSRLETDSLRPVRSEKKRNEVWNWALQRNERIFTGWKAIMRPDRWHYSILYFPYASVWVLFSIKIAVFCRKKVKKTTVWCSGNWWICLCR